MLAAIPDQSLLDFEQRDVRRATDQAHEVRVMGFNAAGATVASAGFGRNLACRLELLLTQRTALAMLILNSLAAALRDSPSSTTASTTRLRRSSESAIPAASFAARIMNHTISG